MMHVFYGISGMKFSICGIWIYKKYGLPPGFTL